ncbi:SDR family oxidoreductase [Actinospica durhamensis]|uniref:SDR family oxidoreductase n=1 Tax=Actinospica durhamensis TaxID=1508375 RepID=A0A941ISA7_9ACTN|nr:SDR family oxidoreductase [Actinospica durhamensis]MBR7834718.1 SDR family oxidoreductase [Actinospica durhamensis]
MTMIEDLFSLRGRSALVTGGSSGIGAAMAEAIAGAGARTVLLARREGPLREAVARITEAGGEAHAVSADIGDRAELARAAEEAVGLVGEIDILVNCAAVMYRPHLDEHTVEQWDSQFAADVDAPFLLGQRFAPKMAERGWGRIINVGSQQSISAFGNSGGYGAAKAALAGLTRSQAEAWSARGVCVNTIIPGFVLTPLTEQTARDEQRVAALAARHMVNRNGVPDDFRGAAVFLASEAARFVTGQILFVDGGFSVH